MPLLFVVGGTLERVGCCEGDGSFAVGAGDVYYRDVRLSSVFVPHYLFAVSLVGVFRIQWKEKSRQKKHIV